MRIIAINDGHNASAILLVDGKVVSAVQEERFARTKNYYGFPQQALTYLLHTHQLKPDDISHFLMCSYYVPTLSHSSAEEHIRNYKKNLSFFQIAKNMAKKAGAKRALAKLMRKKRTQFLADWGIPAERIEYVDHHTCHAASAYYGHGVFDAPILVLTNDGAGDDVCASVWIGENGRLRKLSTTHMDHSIGELWAVTTAYMGMRPLEHEYKLMGMAPYAPTYGEEKVKAIFDGFFQFVGSGINWRTTNGTPPIPRVYNHLREQLEFMRFDWVCAGLQSFTEAFLTQWVQNCIAETGISRLALAGGTFMNVKLNQRILELPEVDSLFIFPSCGDETNPFGAGYLKYYTETKQYPEPVRDLYLGTEWSNENILAAFQVHPFTSKVRIEKVINIEQETACLLTEGHVVARFHGREEFGARALGARSILADPTRSNIIKHINAIIKSRDFWMPFALSVLDTEQERYLVNPKEMSAPYMIITFDTQHVDEIAAGIHPYDDTCRPQVVMKDWNPSYYRLLTQFKRMTGRGALLNTSFNLHGLPLASSPDDAFHVLDQSGLQYLAIGDYLVSVDANPQRLESNTVKGSQMTTPN